MIEIVIDSKKYPIDNILVHIRVFLIGENSYGNISGLKTDEFGSVLLSKELIKQSLQSSDFEEIIGFGLSFLDVKIIEQLKQTYKRYETIGISEIENELKEKGFNEDEVKNLASTTLKELMNQAKMLPFYELNNNHLVPNIAFENEFKFNSNNTNVIIDIDSV